MQIESNTILESGNIQPQKLFKILLIGESCIDEYVYGDCTRLSPEAPVPILKYSHTDRVAGMAANVYANLRAFDMDVEFITQPTPIVKTRYVDDKFRHQILRVDNDGKHKEFDNDVFLEENDQSWDCVVISDYNKGFLEWEFVNFAGRDFDCPVFIDSKKTNLSCDDAFVKVNEQESYRSRDMLDPIVTLGSRGTKYKNKIYPAEEVNVFDVCGAGDTFLAALVYFYLTTGSIESAIPYANKAGAIAVSHFGTYTLTKEDVNEIRN